MEKKCNMDKDKRIACTTDLLNKLQAMIRSFEIEKDCKVHPVGVDYHAACVEKLYVDTLIEI